MQPSCKKGHGSMENKAQGEKVIKSKVAAKKWLGY